MPVIVHRGGLLKTGHPEKPAKVLAVERRVEVVVEQEYGAEGPRA
ncbi:hypothetical protein ACFWFU_22685 [Streptomyces sp. NPDC060235]